MFPSLYSSFFSSKLQGVPEPREIIRWKVFCFLINVQVFILYLEESSLFRLIPNSQKAKSYVLMKSWHHPLKGLTSLADGLLASV